MTAIVGVVDSDGDVFIGGDTAGTTRCGSQNQFANKKVFSPVGHSSFLIGVCGSFRLAQVLRYHFDPPTPPGPSDSFEEYLSTVFAAELMNTFTKAGMFEDFGEGVSGAFMVGYQGMLATIQDNFQAMMPRVPFAAIGSGDSVCHGALYATENVAPTERIVTALKSASHYESSVREPFDIMVLPFDKQWTASKVKKKKSRASAKK